MGRLDTYRAKRDFARTREPSGDARPGREAGGGFVVHKHAARRLHYDLRLEHDGALWSWAVTRGPSLDPAEKRLAVHVEDHPLDYAGFEGTIPEGEYGAGAVIVWDRGRWQPEGDAERGIEKGHLAFSLKGEKLTGRWHLVRLKPRRGEKRDNWLLIKVDDEAARDEGDILDEAPASVLSGRTIEQVAADDEAEQPAANKPAGKRRMKAAAAVPAQAEAPAAKASAAKRSSSEPSALAVPPAFVEPELATLEARPPEAEGWLHEVKFDGYRMQARIEAASARLLTRSGLDWTGKFGVRLAEALGRLDCRNALIDGEVVAFGENGLTSFSALQDMLGRGATGDLIYFAFDMLFHDGEDLRARPLAERRARLESLIRDADDGPLRLSEQFAEPGGVMLRHACRMGLEGVVSKRLAAPYRSGRGRDWIKSKCTDRQEFVVTGYVPSQANARALGSITVGWHRDGRLEPAGRVGTGFTAKSANRLKTALDAIRADASPYEGKAGREKGIVWVRPELVAEVEFRGVTPAGSLRHASFLGLREDKPAGEVVPERPADEPDQPAARPKRRGKPVPETPQAPPARAVTTIRLTSPEKLLWPEPPLSKQGLLDYYAGIWPRIEPHVAGRPLSLVRAPDGIAGKSFFQKHASPGMPEAIRRSKDRDGDELLHIEDFDGLAALVQMGTAEIHVWGSRIGAIEMPDQLIFDLDPGPGIDLARLRTATLVVRDRLAELGFGSYVRTSGGKGFHVVAPIAPKAEWPRAKQFCHDFARALAAEEPAGFTATLSKKARNGRIFIDYLRNGRGATAIAPFSTRARPGAAVAAIIPWEKLAETRPDQFSAFAPPPASYDAASRIEASASL